MKITSFLSAAAALCFAGSVFAQEHEPRVADLLNQARQAESDGRHEEAGDLRKQARKLNQASKKEEKKESKRSGEKPRDKARSEAAEQRRDLRKDEGVRRDEEPRKKHVARAEHAATDRSHHVKEAVMHLRKAGMSDVAQRVEQQARTGDVRPERERGGMQQPRSRMRGAALMQHRQRVQETDRRIDELQKQIQTMARELNELREQQKRGSEQG